jgi:large subunit ribosomal protein L1
MSKRSKSNASLVELGKKYDLAEAMSIVKKTMPAKFDQSVDMQFKLTADPNASDQVIRGTTSLPHGTGKTVRVVVLTKDESGKDAKAAGADEVGGDELVQRIMDGWMDFDVVVASPSMMRDIAKLGRVLGPRGLMPSPKAGTVTDKLAEAVTDIKKGRIEIKMDKQRNLHVSIGRLSFTEGQLTENARALFASVQAARPKTLKGDLIASCAVSATMGPGVSVNILELVRAGGDVDE